jgi:hypothetical protein
MTSTGQVQQSGVSTASASDVALGVSDGTKFAVGELLLLDSERMLIVDIAGGVLTVKRAYDGSVLGIHSGATIYAPRLLTVVRGTLGTTAATHLINAAVARQAPPSLVRDLNLAEAANQVLQETSGYALVVGEGDTVRPASGAGLAELWAEVTAGYGRNTRSRVI